MFGKWVGDGVWLLRWDRNGFVIDQILYGVSEAEAVVGGMAYVLMIGTISIRVMGGR